MSAFTSWVQTVTKFEANKIDPWTATRNTIGLMLPLALGVAFHQVPVGIAISTGALNVSFSDSHAPYLQRGRRMLAASILVGLAVALGGITGRYHLPAIAITLVWAFSAGMLVALSTTAADLGTISLVTLLVYSAAPMDPARALGAGVLAFTGGLLQTVLALAFWPFRRFEPERKALGDLYLQIGVAAQTHADAAAGPPATAESIAAQDALASVYPNRTVEAERYRMLLSQAERARLSLLALKRLRARISREAGTEQQVNIITAFLATFASSMKQIGDWLHSTRMKLPLQLPLEQLESAAESLRACDQRQNESLDTLVCDARAQMDALVGQLRAAHEMASATGGRGLSDFGSRENRRPWALRLEGTLAILRANLTFSSAACRHALRLAVCVGIADAIGRAVSLQRAYWMPMTIAIVLKPDFTATFSRGTLRLAGTFIGLLLATALFHFAPPGSGLEVVWIGFFMFVMRCYGPANYGIFVAAVSAMVVLLLAMTGISPSVVISARAWNTALGGAIALAAYWIWPTWEKTQVHEALANMLDLYREYFRAVRMSYEHQGEAVERDDVRVRARVARTNLEASAERLAAEPGVTPETLKWVSAVLASSHRFIHAVMSMEAGLSSSQPVPPRDMFHTFSNQVEFTLYYLSAALRGSRIPNERLPDLRETHHELVHSPHSPGDRYTLVNIETDRITNALNTLSEEVQRWTQETEPALAG